MTIFWTALAKLKLQEIYDYYFEEVGFEIAENITSVIVRETLRLINTPYIGQKNYYWRIRQLISDIWFIKTTKPFIGSMKRKTGLILLMFLIAVEILHY